jgi:hypothetical protein
VVEAPVDSGHPVGQRIPQGKANDYKHKRANGEGDALVTFESVEDFPPIRFLSGEVTPAEGHR